jgi:hypothetical protein
MPEQQVYSICPKCRHAPLPANQSLPAACPACGLVLAKFAQPLTRALPVRDESAEDGDEDTPRWKVWAAQCVDALQYIPARVEPITFWTRVVLLAAFTIWGIQLIAMNYRYGELGGSFIHGPLLVFHEAGHVIFRLFGEFMMVAGGTIGQLLMPAILCGALLSKGRDPFGAAIGLWLVGVSLLDIAPYAYDALNPQLVLLGGRTGEEGGHDWIYLLSEAGLLKRAHAIGGLAHKLGALVMLTSMAWAAWILWQQKHRLTKDAGLGEDVDR